MLTLQVLYKLAHKQKRIATLTNRSSTLRSATALLTKRDNVFSPRLIKPFREGGGGKKKETTENYGKLQETTGNYDGVVGNAYLCTVIQWESLRTDFERITNGFRRVHEIFDGKRARPYPPLKGR